MWCVYIYIYLYIYIYEGLGFVCGLGVEGAGLEVPKSPVWFGAQSYPKPWCTGRIRQCWGI